MNKVINYISYQSFPAETANSLQTISNLKYLKKNNYEVRLFFPLREKNSSDDLKTIQKYYLLNQEIDISGIKHPYPFGKIKYFNKLLFHISHYLWARSASKKFNDNKYEYDFFLTRSDWILFFLAKKNYKIIFECHQYSKVRNFVFNKVASMDNVKVIFLNDFIRNEFNKVDSKNILLPSGVDLEIFDTPEADMRVSKKVSVITKQSIALDMPLTSADLLYYGGGVRIQKTQGGGGSPVIRGFEANRVLLVIDGVRMNNAIYRSGHLQNVLSVDPQTLERTEVIFGPSSVAYGSDALGGVVHFYTKTPSFNSETQTVINGFQSFNPSFNHSISSLNVEFSKNKWASFTNFSYSTFGDIIMGKKRNHGFKEWGLNKHYLDFDTLNNSNLDNPNPNLLVNQENHFQICYIGLCCFQF